MTLLQLFLYETGKKNSPGSLPPPLSLGKPQSGFRVIVFVETLHLTFSRQLRRL